MEWPELTISDTDEKILMYPSMRRFVTNFIKLAHTRAYTRYQVHEKNTSCILQWEGSLQILSRFKRLVGRMILSRPSTGVKTSKSQNEIIAPRGEGYLRFQDTGLCHSNRKITTHTINLKKFLKITLINLQMLKKCINEWILKNHTHKSGKCKHFLNRHFLIRTLS